MKIPRFFRTNSDLAGVAATERVALGYLRGLLVAAAMGALGALAAQSFRTSLDHATTWLFGREGDISHVFATLPWYVRVACPVIGAAIAALILAQALRREKADGTVSEYLETIDGKTDRIPVIPSLLRCVSSFFSIVSGGSIGKEGAMVQLSATAASWLCYPFRAGPGRGNTRLSVLRGEDFRLAVALAATGGLAAVYHTPLAAAIFVAEIAYGGLELRRVGFLFTAAAAATWVVSVMGHFTPLYALPPFAFDVTGPGMLAIMLVGVAAGAAGAIFLRVVRLARTGFARLHGSLVVRMALGGLVVGLITLVAPEVTGNGFAPVVSLLDGQALSSPLLILLALKILATAATVGSGAIGGMFTPSLMIGALAGSACAPLAAQWLGVADSTVLLGVAGMAAGLAATTQAPLMSTLMVFEMTQESTFVFPLMLATVVAYATSMALGDSGAYSVTARHRARSDRRSRLADATAGMVMRPLPNPVGQDTPLREAVAVGVAGKNRFVFVVDDDLHFKGAVWLQDVVARVNANQAEAEAAIGTSTYVADLPVVYADQRLFDIWQTVVESPAERTPVLADAQSRRLVGVLNKSELLKQARQLFA